MYPRPNQSAQNPNYWSKASDRVGHLSRSKHLNPPFNGALYTISFYIVSVQYFNNESKKAQSRQRLSESSMVVGSASMRLAP